MHINVVLAEKDNLCMDYWDSPERADILKDFVVAVQGFLEKVDPEGLMLDM